MRTVAKTETDAAAEAARPGAGPGRAAVRLTGAALHARDQEGLAFIAAYIRKHGGVSPSFDEIAAALGVLGKGNVWKMVERLVDRGHLERLPGRARALRVIPRETYFVWDEDSKELVPWRRR